MPDNEDKLTIADFCFLYLFFLSIKAFIKAIAKQFTFNKSTIYL